jgi:hypothetical protein
MRSIGRPRHTKEDDTKMDLKMRGCGLDSHGSDKVPVAGLVKMVLNLQFPQKVGNFLNSRATTSFSVRTVLEGVIFFCASTGFWIYIKGKIKLSLCFLTEHHAMEEYWESGGIAPLIP